MKSVKYHSRWRTGYAPLSALACGLLCQSAFAQARYTYAQPVSSQSKPSSTVRESRDTTGQSPSARMVEKSTQNGGKEATSRSWQNLSGAGTYQPSAESEEETVRVDSQTLRVVRRSVATDSDGRRKVVAMTEEETRTLPDGKQTVVRTTSQPDLNNRFQVVRRDLEESTTKSPGTTETKTTVMMPGLEEKLVAHEQIIKVEHKQGDGQTIQTTHSLPNGNGGWQINKVEDKVIQAGKDGSRTEEEKVSQRDAQQNLSVSKQVITKGWKDAAGQQHELVETYLTNTPGTTASGNGHLTLDQRLRVLHRKSSDGIEHVEAQQEERDPNAFPGQLRVTQKATETRDGSGSTTKQGTVQTVDANGYTRVISVFNTRTARE